MSQDTELPVKVLEEFESFMKNAGLTRRKGFWFTCIGFSGLTGIFTFVALAAFHVVNPNWFYPLLFTAILFTGMHVVGLNLDWKTAQEHIYKQYLSKFSHELLRAVAESPEYSDQTKDAVMNYLSTAHPGWSLPASS